MNNDKKIELTRENLNKLTEAKLELDGKLEELALRKPKRKEKKNREKMGLPKQKRLKLKFFQRQKLAKQPEKTYIITMMFGNGTLKTWAITTSNSTFKLHKKMYFINYEECYYDISLNQYHLFYHEGFPSPLNREIIVKGKEAFFKVSPDNMEGYVGMRYLSALTRVTNIKVYIIAIIIELVIILVLGGYIIIKGGGG